jgi:CubicO group peptidase (beta-lactamase class C family)
MLGQRFLAQRLFCICLTVAVAAAASSLPAKPPKFDAEKLASIGPAMQKFVDDGEISGAVLAIGTADGLVYHEAIGKQSLESGKPMPKDAIFRIASMTKPITSLGIMILSDEGKLAVDDPVEKHLPEFKGQMLTKNSAKDTGDVSLVKPARPITLKDCLTHSSGMQDWPAALNNASPKRDHTLAEIILLTSQRPLDFPPGSKFKYCQTGMDTLGRTIEVKSGKSYEDFLAERVFKPLGMKDSAFYVTSQNSDRLAEMYAKRDGKLVATGNAPNPVTGDGKNKPKYPSPAGGLFSTAEDLAKVYRMLLNHGKSDGGQLISEAAHEAMTKVQSGDLQTGFTPGNCWGLGVCMVREPQGVTGMLSPGTYGHGGAFGTQGWIDPHKGVFLILMIQRSGLPNADGSEVRKQFQALAMGAIEGTAADK